MLPLTFQDRSILLRVSGLCYVPSVALSRGSCSPLPAAERRAVPSIYRLLFSPTPPPCPATGGDMSAAPVLAAPRVAGRRCQLPLHTVPPQRRKTLAPTAARPARATLIDCRCHRPRKWSATGRRSRTGRLHSTPPSLSLPLSLSLSLSLYSLSLFLPLLILWLRGD